MISSLILGLLVQAAATAPADAQADYAAAQAAWKAERAAWDARYGAGAAVPKGEIRVTGRRLPKSVNSTRQQVALDDAVSKQRKTVCRTSLDTGSLVKRTRSCGTAESWARRSLGERQAARDFVEASASGITSN